MKYRGGTLKYMGVTNYKHNLLVNLDLMVLIVDVPNLQEILKDPFLLGGHVEELETYLAEKTQNNYRIVVQYPSTIQTLLGRVESSQYLLQYLTQTFIKYSMVRYTNYAEIEVKLVREYLKRAGTPLKIKLGLQHTNNIGVKELYKVLYELVELSLLPEELAYTKENLGYKTFLSLDDYYEEHKKIKRVVRSLELLFEHKTGNHSKVKGEPITISELKNILHYMSTN